ncbi:glycosyltransferase family 39 protein [Candidatus Binatus soli]|jgi:4-amino-4-deoxy-L-arabinose transferase-like glycosyltransferase|uniref:glycosyltransferase family 39 protein n=1 Tax=Candidatus Binatus soli TaxID=1953413 RepID=UPI003D11E618
MSPDEGASWAAASAPTAAEVIARQPALNPGELPIHDLMLHGWIALFGSSVAAMRAMSAALGVVSILLVYLVVCELFALGPEGESALTRDDIGIVAGLAALVFAVNLVTIKYSREARMYPLMLAAILAQVAMFIRAFRVGGLANYAAVVLLTAIAIASNFAGLLVPATEGLWLLNVVVRARWRPDHANARRAWTLAILLAAAGLILVPKLLSSLRTASAGSVGGWRKPPAVYAPFALFNKATGSFAFPILAALAIWGAVRGWRRGARDAVGFALLWMWAPPLMMVAASYTIAPVFVERYALSCFVPFFILVALGIFELQSDLIRVGALVLAVAFSVGHIVSYDRKPHDAQYREAIAAASSALKPGDVMTIVPAYAIEVIRYYLPADQFNRAVRYDASASAAAVLILGDQNLAPRAARSYRKEYPDVVARLRGVTVLRR